MICFTLRKPQNSTALPPLKCLHLPRMLRMTAGPGMAVGVGMTRRGAAASSSAAAGASAAACDSAYCR